MHARRWSLGLLFYYLAIFAYLVNLAALVLMVVISSFASEWFGGILPREYTLRWYAFSWEEYTLGQVLWVTVIVAIAVAGLSLALGFPAAYAMARHDFRGKGILMGAYLLPMLIPPMTYGIPLAAVIYKMHLGGTLIGVILVNLVPVLPFAILILTPFLEQINPSTEAAARVHGARPLQVFGRILLPLSLPGMFAAALLVMIRTIAMFDLTFLVAGPKSQTLVVTLFEAVFTPGIRPTYSIDAMAVVFMLMATVLLLIALRFGSPTQIVLNLDRR